ncbi:hypothetical protein C8J56DRAFT_900516 [Mycena floridula]|nr:hypothetical protein C8J56DRAFT_900516 [Mycena floridula]
MSDNATTDATTIQQIGHLLSQFLCLPRGSAQWIKGAQDLLQQVHPLMENHVLYLAINNLQDVGQFFVASDALAIMGGCLAPPISILEPRLPFSSSQSSSSGMSITAISQILRQTPGLVPSLSSSRLPSLTPTPALSKPVNMGSLFIAPAPATDASFNPVVTKFLQPAPCPLVEPDTPSSGYKKSASKSGHKAETPAIEKKQETHQQPHLTMRATLLYNFNLF